MHQLTLRISEELARELKAEAQRLGKSVNAFATEGLLALVDPDAEGDEVERLRAKLRRAGLLADTGARRNPPQPSDAELREARKAFSGGKSLSDYVSEGRD